MTKIKKNLLCILQTTKAAYK